MTSVDKSSLRRLYICICLYLMWGNINATTIAGDANFEDPENAQAIVVPGWEISATMEQDKWDAILEHPQIVFARTSPQQKLVIVENNQVRYLGLRTPLPPS